MRITVPGICAVSETTSNKMGGLLARRCGVRVEMDCNVVSKLHFAQLRENSV